MWTLFLFVYVFYLGFSLFVLGKLYRFLMNN